MAQLEQDNKKTEMDATISAAELALRNRELALKEIEDEGRIQTEQQYISLEKEKIEAEKATKIVKHANDFVNMHHKHKMDHLDRHHKGQEIDVKRSATEHRVTANPHYTGEK